MREPLHRNVLAGAFVFVAATASAAGAEVIHVTVPNTAVGGAEVDVTNLLTGDSVEFYGQAGIVNFNTGGLGGCIFSVGPGGLPRATYEDPGNWACYFEDLACGDPMPTSPHAGLLALIGQQAWFLGSVPGQMQAAADVTVKLGIDDCVATPNAGSFSVWVRVTRPIFSDGFEDGTTDNWILS